ncbi:heavy metal translocating P-type ATPase [Pseudomonas typographi]|uniref:Cadmium-translocating P-type ATPase n=1 Tax=Pseudomonas typographi TaxID=2715964 RepID=A0ABR7Z124_9PSED|nr:heavy metal translocating P-type ATPase [Pseudomonas typographi]MBD1599016.1 cadmium-translocating P-type ATPase [Pseudomonas typographi]
MINCYHCQLPVAYPGRYRASVAGQVCEFCCPGCQAVAETIAAAGLEQFYHYRDGPSLNPRELARPALAELAVYDRPDLTAQFTHSAGQGREATLRVQGITCAACAWLIERKLGQLPGVQQVQLNLANHRLHLRWQAPALGLGELIGQLQALGYGAEPWQPDTASDALAAENRSALRRLGVAGLLWFQAMMATMATWPEFNLDLSPALHQILRWAAFMLTTPIVFYSCGPLFRGAWRALRARHLSMDLSAALAIGLAYGAGIYTAISGQGELYFDTVGMFALFLLGSRYLERRARERTLVGSQGLARLLPATCLRCVPGAEAERVLLAELRPGDRVQVPGGGQVPADGVILAGQAQLDEALLTGESQAQARGPGEAVNAGTLNLGSALLIEVTATGSGTRMSAIMRLLEQAQAQKPALAQWADRAAQVFLGSSLLLAALFGAVWSWLDASQAFWVVLALLVATCPCALSLAIPTALTAATASLQRMGLLVLRGDVLENLNRIDTLVLDKTGTLSEGQPTLQQVLELGAVPAAKALDWAAALQAPVDHPLARAFGPSPVVAEAVHSEPGRGLEGVVAGQRLRLGDPAFVSQLAGTAAPKLPTNHGQWLLLGNGQGPLAWFAVHDRLRPQAPALVDYARARGWRVLILSGDRSPALAEVAAQLDVQAEGGLTPEQKLSALQRLRAEGRRVLVVGDGANDAPLLAAADVGIAMGAGTDLSKARADAVLLSNDLASLPRAFALAARGRRIVLQNLAWAALYNTLVLPFAAFDLITPAWAALGMSVSSLAVVLNALRLGRTPPATAQEVPTWPRSTC